MPTISDYVEVEAEIDISVSDFLDECSIREKEELAELLVEEGYAYKVGNLIDGRGYTAREVEEALFKIAENYYRLPQEDTSLILEIAKRL